MTMTNAGSTTHDDDHDRFGPTKPRRWRRQIWLSYPQCTTTFSLSDAFSPLFISYFSSIFLINNISVDMLNTTSTVFPMAKMDPTHDGDHSSFTLWFPYLVSIYNLQPKAVFWIRFPSNAQRHDKMHPTHDSPTHGGTSFSFSLSDFELPTTFIFRWAPSLLSTFWFSLLSSALFF